MYTPVSTRAASAYKSIAVETGVQGASDHQLIELLFDGLIQSLNEARGALQRGDVPTKGRKLGKAVRILEEGLKACLNPTGGGELAQNLQGLYDYSVQRLTLANMRNDEQLIVEVMGLIEPLAQSWKSIRGATPTAASPTPGRGA